MPTLCECPDISIIVPVYNLERFIKPLLISLKAQDLGDYKTETFFVLNNCTDNSEKVIRDSGLECQILNCEIQGCGAARNVGLEHATGEYLWFVDGDDWLLEETAIQDALDAAKGRDIFRIPYASDHFSWNYFSMVWQYILRREFVQEFRFPNYQPGEDDAYMEQVLQKAGYNKWNHMQVPHLDRPLYFYNYLREGSNMYQVNVLHRKI